MLELFRSKHTSFVWFAEAILILAMLIVAADVHVPWEATPRLARFLAEAAIAVFVAQGSMYFCGLYADEPLLAPQKRLGPFARAIAIAASIVVLVGNFVGMSELRTAVVLVGMSLSAITVPLWRYAYQSISRNEHFARRALVLGSGELADDIAELIRTRCLGLHLVGFLRRPNDPDLPGVIGSYDDLSSVAASDRIDVVIVADTDRRGSLPVEQLLSLKLNGIEICEATTFYERMTGKIHVLRIKPSELFFTEGFDSKPLARRTKRAFDVIASVCALVLVAPIMALTALAIRLESRGPIFYRQIRVGAHRQEFWIVKFRSMRTDAEKEGARWASVIDDRVTRVGRFIRKTRIDELPQLWNVLRGDMSLVGPRPERPIFVDELERRIPYFSQRLYVRPGVTGHAQVRCRYAASVEDSVEKLQYDLYYIKRFSLMFDLSILLDTVKVVLLRIGSR